MDISCVTIIGQGNVASHYYNIMNEKGIKTKMLSSRLPFQSKDLQTDLIIIAVKDDAIESVTEALLKDLYSLLPLKTIVVHTSGFLSTQCLASVSSNYGSFYPLQTLKKGIDVNFDTVPLCTWANNVESADKLRHLAMKLSKIHYNLDDNQRKILHLAAVFVNNFPNHLFGIAKRILEKENVPFDILYPLMERTVKAAEQYDPFSVQTGPAFRKEKTIMQQHKQLLSDKEKQIYDILSDSIIEQISK